MVVPGIVFFSLELATNHKVNERLISFLRDYGWERKRERAVLKAKRQLVQASVVSFISDGSLLKLAVESVLSDRNFITRETTHL